VLVIDNDTLDALERDVDNLIDLIEALVSGSLSSSLLQVKPEILDAPLRTMLFVVVL
jgi:hypothetical protein